jgi:hypothetical protein
MNVLAFASRKGGAGKSTLAAHLAVHVYAGRCGSIPPWRDKLAMSCRLEFAISRNNPRR